MIEKEWQTRKKRIDIKLDASGWPVVDGAEVPGAEPHRLEEWETSKGPADYALCKDGCALAIAEAKKVGLGPMSVLTQAERYARGVVGNPFDFDGLHVPFLYATNGELVWFHDVRHSLNRSREIAGFHTPEALEELLERDLDSALDSLAKLPNDHPLLRPYQREANAKIEEALRDRKRQMLVAMATGTGKTLLTVNEVYRLMRTGIARRVLFLVDRRALAAQAVRAFASFEAEPGQKFNQIYELYNQQFQRDDLGPEDRWDPNVLPKSYLTDPKLGSAFVYVSTIQRMAINLFGRGAVFSEDPDSASEQDAEQLDIPIHAFDLVIADECHRGYTTQELSVWRRTLDHFDATRIGLTATPAAHTKAYFKDVVFRYDYERAVREGHLVDYDVVALRSNVRIDGVFLREGDHVDRVDPETGTKELEELEDERQFPAPEVERQVTSPDSNRKILEEIRRYAEEHEAEYGRFPKTLIFAANDLPHTSHADQLVDIARDVFGRGDAYVQKITGRVDRPLQRIREFRNRLNPAIAVSVDLMTTGIDIPDLEFIVFLRPVKSRILFEQMLGRGTRKGERHPDKSHFTVFDCFDGTLLEYFRHATGITAEPPERAQRSIRDLIEAIWRGEDRDYNVRCLSKRLQRIDRELSGEAREAFARWVPQGALGEFARQLSKHLSSDFVGVMEILRDTEFQDQLENYPRPSRTFLVAGEYEDTVISDWLIRGADGKEYKPEDYLAAFDAFIRENAEAIEAISILLDRPQDWSTEALGQLRLKLEETPQRFLLRPLQRAFELCHHKALIDLISMVKHAAREEEPLLTAQERVAAAFDGLTANRKFTPEQERWLERIRQHLVENLSLDERDFDDQPIFERTGGYGRADKVFEGQLESLIRDINEAIAA